MLAKNISYIEGHKSSNSIDVEFDTLKYKFLLDKIHLENKKAAKVNLEEKSKITVSKLNAPQDKVELDSEQGRVVYQKLRKAMAAGEAWAHKIFWRDLVPKRKDTVIIDYRKDELEALLEGLSQFTELTYNEVLAEIKVLSSIKFVQDEKVLSINEKKLIKDKASLFLESYQNKNRIAE